MKAIGRLDMWRVLPDAGCQYGGFANVEVGIHADNRTVACEVVVVAELSPMIPARKEKARI